MNKETFDSLHKHGIEHMHVQVPPREGIENRKKKLEDIEDERCREDENAKQLLGLIERRRLEYLACLGNINVLDQPPDLVEAALARMVLKSFGQKDRLEVMLGTGIGLLTSGFEFQFVKKVIELSGSTMINGTDFNIRANLY